MVTLSELANIGKKLEEQLVRVRIGTPENFCKSVKGTAK